MPLWLMLIPVLVAEAADAAAVDAMDMAMELVDDIPDMSMLATM